MNDNPLNCLTCTSHTTEERSVYAGRKCPRCSFPFETSITVHLCKGEMIGSHIIYAGQQKGLACHSSFPDSDKIVDDLAETLLGKRKTMVYCETIDAEIQRAKRKLRRVPS